MNTFSKLIRWAVYILVPIAFISFIFTLIVISADSNIFNCELKIDPPLASNIGSFIGGLFSAVFSLVSILLVILTLVYQAIENKKNIVANQFFQMLDFQNQYVTSLSVGHIRKKYKNKKIVGRRAFVIFKMQIEELLKAIKHICSVLNLQLSEKDLIDITYVTFFYGLDEKSVDFISNKLCKHKQYEDIVQHLLQEKSEFAICRTNQTSLGTYFRNMYNAIKLIDSNVYLSREEKSSYIKILRAQLSNPELYVLYFNVMSRFGKKWKSKNYIEKYELLTNLPFGYCGEFHPENSFNIHFEYTEIEE